MTPRTLQKLLSRSPTFTTSEALRAGLTPRTLYSLRESGELFELSRGVFRAFSAPKTAHLSLLAVARRVPKGIICLHSALTYWDLTDELPGTVHVAVPRGSAQPVVAYPPTSVHVFNRETFELGRVEESLTAKERIAIYSPERTVIDVMRARNQVGRDLAFKALQRYLQRPRAKPGELIKLARLLRVEKPVADALEVLSA